MGRLILTLLMAAQVLAFWQRSASLYEHAHPAFLKHSGGTAAHHLPTRADFECYLNWSLMAVSVTVGASGFRRGLTKTICQLEVLLGDLVAQ